MVNEAGNSIVNYSTVPWKTPGKSSNSAKPAAVELQAKVLHCAALDSSILIPPHPKAWTITQAMEWLDEHPITAEDGISLIFRAIAVQKDAAKKGGR